MEQVIDARGLSCPQPVLLVQKAIETGEFPIEVLVDSVTSRENVFRMAKHRGFKVAIENDGEEFRINITK
jgi:tRNA 2-thiouridine synthesizing protein A